MKHLLKLFFALAVAGSTGCIKNDIPYPVVKLAITSIAGEGFTVKEIDPAQRIVTLTLDETTDIRNVRITQVAYTEGAQASVDLTASSHDMRVPVRLTLTLYQDYEWTIIAEQQINRTFKCRFFTHLFASLCEGVLDMPAAVRNRFYSSCFPPGSLFLWACAPAPG